MDLPSRKERRQSVKQTIKQTEMKSIRSAKNTKSTKRTKITKTFSNSKTNPHKKGYLGYLFLVLFLLINGFLIYTLNTFLLLFSIPALLVYVFLQFFQINKKVLVINLICTFILTIGIFEVLYRQNFQ
ncbi:hypothetical protein SAMN00017405_0349 [Desulfonispora thiosulfatigenes DSM 11270]|uniref:Uncharacterized protein n=1 Tax=Desulfonispora thiosulfatigenes DSM 11270 TaxID=656914 RepID=A0A1W1VP90_DESTI|nr:hypothetical protein SAMN00017405_0349 [Desulfonispora thiosulfatigenes DSM 11270]